MTIQRLLYCIFAAQYDNRGSFTTILGKTYGLDQVLFLRKMSALRTCWVSVIFDGNLLFIA